MTERALGPFDGGMGTVGPSRFIPHPFMIMSILSIILSATLLPAVCAAPLQKLRARQSNNDNNSTGLSPGIWVRASRCINERRTLNDMFYTP